MQQKERKCIQHKIQHTVAQWGGGGGGGSREKRPNGQKFRREGVTGYLCHYISTTVLYVSNIT